MEPILKEFVQLPRWQLGDFKRKQLMMTELALKMQLRILLGSTKIIGLER
jgi:hypothetical protein